MNQASAAFIVTPPKPDDALRRKSAGALALLSLAGAIAFFAINDWTIGELLRVGAGLLALWFPFGGIIFLAVRSSFQDLLSRLTFAAIASYSLTTLIFFCCSVCDLWIPGFLGLFYLAQILAVIAFIVLGRHWKVWQPAGLHGLLLGGCLEGGLAAGAAGGVKPPGQ